MKQIAWATFDAYASSILAILSIAVISRILTPEEIGVFSTASVFVGIATVLRDFGVSNYLIQSARCNQDLIDTASFTAQAIACASALFLLCIAYPISLFYDEPRLIKTIILLGLNLLLIPKLSVAMALLRRNMQFDSLVSITFGMSLALNMGGVIFAYLGAGYLSMVYGSILANCLGLGLLKIKRINIGYKFDKRTISGITAFGLRNTAINLIRDSRSYANEIVLAKTQGMAIVAYQSKALSIMRLFWGAVMPGIYSFTLPHFAREIRNSADIRRIFFVATGKTMSIALPALAFLAVEGDLLILLLNGPQWEISAEAGRWVPTIYLFGFPLLALAGTLLTAGGYMKELVRIQTLTLPPKIAILIAVMYEPLIVFIVLNVFIEMIVESLLYAYYLKRCYRIRVFEIYRVSFSSYLISFILATTLWISRNYLYDIIDNNIKFLVTQSLIFMIVFLILIRTIPNPLQVDLINFILATRCKLKK